MCRMRMETQNTERGNTINIQLGVDLQSVKMKNETKNVRERPY